MRGLRERIEELGGTVHFRAKVTDIIMSGQRLSGLVLEDGRTIDCEAAILAPGHSARELFAVLDRHAIAMEAKPFAIGLRVEHPQELISRNQYGESWTHPALGPAEYRLAAKGALPVQRFEDFLLDRASSALGKIQPDASGPWALANLVPCLPATVSRAIGEGMSQFKRQIDGYAGKDAS